MAEIYSELMFNYVTLNWVRKEKLERWVYLSSIILTSATTSSTFNTPSPLRSPEAI